MKRSKFYENNQKFRTVAESNGYGHVYLEGPGDHEWPYWDKMIQRAIQFFFKFKICRQRNCIKIESSERGY